MAIEAPLSKDKKNSLMIAIIAMGGFGLWCLYDGYFNQGFINEHTNQETNEPDSDLIFNQKAPPILFAGALGVGAYFWMIRKRRIIATDTDLVISSSLSIPYGSITQIDKTHFDKKGYFVLSYQSANGAETTCRLDDRKNDNLQALLDHLVTQIT